MRGIAAVLLAVACGGSTQDLATELNRPCALGGCPLGLSCEAMPPGSAAGSFCAKLAPGEDPPLYGCPDRTGSLKYAGSSKVFCVPLCSSGVPCAWGASCQMDANGLEGFCVP